MRRGVIIGGLPRPRLRRCTVFRGDGAPFEFLSLDIRICFVFRISDLKHDFAFDCRAAAV